MFSCLLTLFCLQALLHASFAQKPQPTSDVPDNCLVNKASGQPFIPPSPYPKSPSPGGFWFGTDRLWIAPPSDGIWRLGPWNAIDPTFRQKMGWWRQGYDAHAEPNPKLKVTGKLLNGSFPLPPVAVDVGNVTGSTPEKNYMMVGLDFPGAGCWEITGRYEDDELTFVVWVTPSSPQVVKWTETDRKDYLARAESGDVGAQFWLGAAYEQGWFGKINFEEALRWYGKAAAQNDADAQNSLGQMYANGNGVKQDYVKAAEWYRLAAEHTPDLGGAGQGRSNLGMLYMEGDGVPKDFVQAYKWFSLTAFKNNLSYAENQMTPAQIRQAEQLVADWKRDHPEQ
jgi:Sel1 repeat